MIKMANHKRILSAYKGKLAPAQQKRLDRPAEDFVSPYLTMDAIRRTYDICIKPVNSEQYWEPNDLPKPTAPRIFRPPGRPQKKRTEAGAPHPPPAPVNGDK
ncbi:hypothetical protein PIB30_108621, partial [Stylosanthes scabra]|nr:hypothetical protein [Stylosanthes scabra]